MTSAAGYRTVQVEQAGPVVIVSLDRPSVRNAFNAEMIAELTQLFTSLGRSDDVRAVVLKGNGPSFSAGADVNWMRASLDFSAEENVQDATRMSDMFNAIDTIPKPVVCRVHGAALGGGMGLIAVCDIVVAAENTVFGFTEVNLGIIPAVISRFVLPKIGESWARALYLSGERFDADLARLLGLVHWVTFPPDLDAVVQVKVNELLSSGPEAVREAKALIRSAQGRTRDEMRGYTAERIAALRAGPEGQEGLRAFLEKRGPRWRPRA